jgi:hypothetical protein
MAIKAGSILTDVNGFVVDRIQSGGPGSLNIPQERIYELGNWKAVSIVRDIPDLSFDLESFDVSTEFECLLVNENPTTFSSDVGSNEIDFNNHIPIDVISPFKSRLNSYDIVKGVGIPFLTLERATYRYGIGQNAAQQFTLRGDSIYYTPGQPYYITASYGGAGTTSWPSAHIGNVIEYDEGNFSNYALCIVAVTNDGSYRRLYSNGTSTGDYTSTANGYTITATGADKIDAMTGATKTLRIMFSSTVTGNYTQTGNNPRGNKIHQGTSVKPAAVRPRDIDVYIGDTAATPTFTRFTGVQSAEANWSVQLMDDQEFGNRHYVLRDYMVPDVTGSIGIKPYDTADMWDKLAQITGVSNDQVIGAATVVPVPVEIRISNPDGATADHPDGILKTIYIPDARFQVPGYSGRIQTKVETQLQFTSDSGSMYVYNGSRVEL